MPVPSRIFNGEDNLKLNRGLPFSSGFERRCRDNALKLATLKAERNYVLTVGYPKLVRDTLMFQKLNFLSNMTQLGLAASIWIQRIPL